MRPCRPAVLALVIALVASAARAEAPCKGSLSGAAKGKFGCVVSVSRSDDGRLLFVITPRDPIPGVPTYAPGAFELPEPLEPRTYTLASLGPGRASVAVEGGALYTATKTSAQRGEVTLSLTSVRRPEGATAAYVVRGRYQARLVPAGAGREGAVVVDVRF